MELLNSVKTKQKLVLWVRIERIKFTMLVCVALVLIVLQLLSYLKSDQNVLNNIYQSRFIAEVDSAQTYRADSLQRMISHLTRLSERQTDLLEQKDNIIKRDSVEKLYLLARNQQQEGFMQQNRRMFSSTITLYDKHNLEQRSILDSMSATLQFTMHMLSDTTFANRLRDATLQSHKGRWEQKTRYYDLTINLTSDSIYSDPRVKAMRVVDAEVVEKRKGPFNKLVSKNIKITVATENPFIDPPKQTFTVPYEEVTEKIKPFKLSYKKKKLKKSPATKMNGPTN